MKTYNFYFLVLLSFITSTKATSSAPQYLLTDNRDSSFTSSATSFIVINTKTPSLTWQLQSTQIAYEIIVTYSNTNLTWQTGRINTNNTLSARYQGRELLADEEAFWKVRVWDKDNITTEWSDLTHFRMGRKEMDWNGVWITKSDSTSNLSSVNLHKNTISDNCSNSAYGDHPNLILRRNFTTTSNVTRAVLHIAGLGYYRIKIDGMYVPGDTYLDPEWTSFDERISYNTHDVTHIFQLLDIDSNSSHVLEIELGNGWYAPLPLLFWGSKNISNSLTTGQPMCRCDLVLEEKGTTAITRTIISSNAKDKKWEVAEGAYLRNNIYLGTVYDQRREKDKKWSTESISEVDPSVISSLGTLLPSTIPPIRAFEYLVGKTTQKKDVGTVETVGSVVTMIYDFSRNFAGTINVTFQGNIPNGTKIEFLYGELLWPNGTVNGMTSVAGQIKSKNMGGKCAPSIAYQKDIFIASGLVNDETYSFIPRFTWHGFRYVSISFSTDSEINDNPIQSIIGIALRTDVATIGSFHVPNNPTHLLNNIFTMAYNTFSSNMMSIQSDCPHRERFGYGGDLLATAQTGMHLFDMSSFYQKRVIDYSDAQRKDGGFTETAPFVGIDDRSVGINDGSGPIGWDSVQIQLELWLNKFYGNTAVLETSYNSTKKWITLLSTVTAERIENGLGDWQNVEPYDSTRLTGHVFKWMNYNAWYEINSILKKTDIANAAKIQSQLIINDLNQLFLNDTNGKYNYGSQCSQSMPLYYNLVPKDSIDAVQSMLNLSLYELGNHTEPQLAVGMFCILPLLSSLSVDVAYRIATRRDYPSFGYMLDQGATTIWESWFYSNNTYSHNHPMFSSVVVWMFRSLGGIQQMDYSVGWSHVLLKPRSPCNNNVNNTSEGTNNNLPGVNVTLNTVRGRIDSNWTRTTGSSSDDTFVWSFQIPLGSIGIIDLPQRERYEVDAGIYVVKNVLLCDH